MAKRCRGKRPRKVALALAAVFLLAGCGVSWQVATTRAAQGFGRAAREAHLYARSMCRPVLQWCIEKQQNPCGALAACHQDRHRLLQIADSAYAAEQAALLAVRLGKKDLAEKWIAYAGEAYAMIVKTLKTWGIEYPPPAREPMGVTK